MDIKQTLSFLAVLLSCLLVATVWCEEEPDVSLEETAASQPQKRSIDPLAESEGYPNDLFTEDEDMDKRGSLFRFGKRGSLFRFGKRGSLFRFGKRGSLFRFGKRGSLFRFGKRNDDMDEEAAMYPNPYLPDDGLAHVTAFHWGRQRE